MKGIIHIGANDGREYVGTTRLTLLFEPVPSAFDRLVKNLGDNPNCVLIDLALGSETKVTSINLADNNAESSSILEPLIHTKTMPHIHFGGKLDIQMTTLDSFMRLNFKEQDLFDEIIIDVQGYELEVFKGATETLKHIQRIKTEINTEFLYKDCVLFDELDRFLTSQGFKVDRIEMQGPNWGDAYYIRS